MGTFPSALSYSNLITRPLVTPLTPLPPGPLPLLLHPPPPSSSPADKDCWGFCLGHWPLFVNSVGPRMPRCLLLFPPTRRARHAGMRSLLDTFPSTARSTTAPIHSAWSPSLAVV